MEPEMTKAVINLTLTAAVSPELREANRKAVMESVRPTMDDIRYRQWQQAMWRVKVMRDELVRLGVTDPAILGSPVMFFTGVKVETVRVGLSDGGSYTATDDRPPDEPPAVVG